MKRQGEAHAAFHRQALNFPNVRGIIGCEDFSPLPILGCNVEMDTKWYHGRVVVRQEFINKYPNAISIFAAVDVPRSWTLCSIRCEIDDKYTFAKLENCLHYQPPTTNALHEPALNVATAKIPWELHVGQSALLIATYFCPLETPSADILRFAFPASVLAAPSQGNEGSGVTEIQSWNDRFRVANTSRLPRTILFKATGHTFQAVEGQPDVQNLSATAQGARLANPLRYEVRFEERPYPLTFSGDRSFEINTVPDEECVTLQACKEASDHVNPEDAYAIVACLTPRFTPEQLLHPNIELVFAVDNSGSMSNFIPMAQKTIDVISHGLPSSCALNVAKFGETVEWLFPQGSESLTAETLAHAKQFTVGMEGNMKGTKLYGAMCGVYDKPYITGMARVIVLLTDGAEPRHGKKLLEMCHTNRHSTRMVALALGGEHVDVNLLSEMAKVSGGFFQHIPEPDTALDAVANAVSVIQKAVVPTLVNVHISFSYDGVEEQPPIRPCSETYPLAPLGTRAVFYAFGHSDLKGFTASVNTLLGPTQIDFKVHSGDIENATDTTNTATPGDVMSFSLPHVACAHERILTLADRNVKSTVSKNEEEEIRRLGVAFGVTSPFTSFFTRTSEQNTYDEADPTGTMICHPYRYETSQFVLPTPVPFKDHSGSAIDPDKYVAQLAQRKKKELGGGGDAATSTTSEFMQKIVVTVVDNICSSLSVEDILIAQESDGAWPVSGHILEVLGHSSVETFLSEKENPEMEDRVHCTIAVRKFLKENYPAGLVGLAMIKSEKFLVEKAPEVLAA